MVKIVGRFRLHAVADAHLALATGALAATGSIDGQASPRRSVEDGRSRWDVDDLATGTEFKTNLSIGHVGSILVWRKVVADILLYARAVVKARYAGVS
jgi:hypothetical protein